MGVLLLKPTLELLDGDGGEFLAARAEIAADIASRVGKNCHCPRQPATILAAINQLLRD
jgi:hypothetical protein